MQLFKTSCLWHPTWLNLRRVQRGEVTKRDLANHAWTRDRSSEAITAAPPQHTSPTTCDDSDSDTKFGRQSFKVLVELEWPCDASPSSRRGRRASSAHPTAANQTSILRALQPRESLSRGRAMYAKASHPMTNSSRDCRYKWL